ncbi:PA2169 family four-helix-bundle protein [Nibrella saemangeumensis]|uniref:PA2169 family four-helix-bundle protein n=1 Tax=Nibrella saemangeumensis TaxID=1084526 RepID=A0ABP8MIR7_9BACT
MTKNEDVVDALNELVEILNDRIRGYQTAMDDSKDAQLDETFRQMILQTQQLRSQLAEHIVRLDGSAVSDTTHTDFSSKIHRAWINIKAAVTGKDREAILSSCEFGDNAAVEAYEDALEEEKLPGYVKDTLRTQLNELRQSRDQIKALHEAAD